MKNAFNTVFFDVDTQIDFLYPAGALYVPGSEALVRRIVALNRHAAANGTPLISTVDAHAEDDPEFKSWPPHCVIDTTGQQKPASTLIEKRVTIPNAPCDVAIQGAQQVVIEKQALDCFTNVNLSRILEQLGAERFVVYGLVAEICVHFAASGLLRTGKRVELITDAVQSLDASAASKMEAAFASQGGVLTTMAEVMPV